jgi:hypothetical protein
MPEVLQELFFYIKYLEQLPIRESLWVKIKIKFLNFKIKNKKKIEIEDF